jgi:hypothetical protein
MTVMPAQAGIQLRLSERDSRYREDDEMAFLQTLPALGSYR